MNWVSNILSRSAYYYHGIYSQCIPGEECQLCSSIGRGACSKSVAVKCNEVYLHTRGSGLTLPYIGRVVSEV